MLANSGASFLKFAMHPEPEGLPLPSWRRLVVLQSNEPLWVNSTLYKNCFHTQIACCLDNCSQGLRARLLTTSLYCALSVLSHTPGPGSLMRDE